MCRRLEKLVTDYLYIDANMESMPSVAYAASKVPAVLQALSGLLTMKDTQVRLLPPLLFLPFSSPLPSLLSFSPSLPVLSLLSTPPSSPLSPRPALSGC